MSKGGRNCKQKKSSRSFKQMTANSSKINYGMVGGGKKNESHHQCLFLEGITNMRLFSEYSIIFVFRSNHIKTKQSMDLITNVFP